MFFSPVFHSSLEISANLAALAEHALILSAKSLYEIVVNAQEHAESQIQQLSSNRELAQEGP
jgi:hypothetical protein